MRRPPMAVPVAPLLPTRGPRSDRGATPALAQVWRSETPQLLAQPGVRRLASWSSKGYYAWGDRPTSARERSNLELLEVIRTIHADFTRHLRFPAGCTPNCAWAPRSSRSVANAWSG
jgi:hypothetical protein